MSKQLRIENQLVSLVPFAEQVLSSLPPMRNTENKSTSKSSSDMAEPSDQIHRVDARQLSCPLPLLKMKQALNRAQIGDTLSVTATDPASERDFKVYLNTTSHKLELTVNDGVYTYLITKCSNDTNSNTKC